jgi:hypothetical protein
MRLESTRHSATVLFVLATLFCPGLSQSWGQQPAPASPAPAGPGTIKINEIRIDQESVGDDEDEYFELFGPASTSLNGYWYVVIGDRAEPRLQGVVEAVIDFTGKSIAPDGFFLVAEDASMPQSSVSVDWVTGLGALRFENNDNITHLLVQNFIGAVGDDLDFDDDGTLDITPWSSIEDCVAVVKNANPDLLGDRIYCGTRVGPALGIGRAFAPGHVYRSGNGGGTWQMGQFRFNAASRDTPGFSNATATGACCDGGVCTPNLTQSACEVGSGVWAGAGTTCSPNICVGACCDGSSCSVQTKADCVSLGRFFRGAGTVCGDVTCPGPIAGLTGLKLNEIWAGDPVTDDLEFIELYLAAAASPELRGGPVSLAGISLIIVDGDTFGDPESGNYKRVSLQVDFGLNASISAPGHFLIASTCVPVFAAGAGERGCIPPVLGITLGSLENHSQTYALVRTQDIAYCQNPSNPALPPAGCQGHVDRHRLTDASAALITANIIDSVATLDANAGDQSYFGAPVVKDGVYQASQMQRAGDGDDSDNPQDWDPQWQLEKGDPGDASTPGTMNIPGTGACCTGNDCAPGETRTHCTDTLGGVYRGNGTDCDPNLCIGACCLGGSCIGEMSAASCATATGAYMGDGIACTLGLCTPIDIATAQGRPPRSPVIVDQLVVLSEDDVVSDGNTKQFNVRRGSEGLTIFGRNSAIDPILSQIIVGDTVTMAGTTDEYLGLFQLTGKVAPIKLIGVSHTGLTPPTVDTLIALDFQTGSAQAEVSESLLVRLNCMRFNDGGTGMVFKGNTTYLATDGSFLVRVFIPTTAAGLIGLPIPGDLKDLRGVLWQEDKHSLLPGFLNSGYRLSMRSASDVLGSVTCAAPLGACCAPQGACACAQMPESLCLAVSGQYFGDGISCTPSTLCSSNRVTGDIDLDTDVDLDDMELFVLALVRIPEHPAHAARSDLNCDGKLNGVDIRLMVLELTP